ncbi:MAG TPA: glutamate-5-semialdehyde dehydrogenase [Candidatus Blautia gallistercoris]|uniref:Gamma-glutamyl phosphate reductase n=1 Tax=Candidatus Blautia gallistercoris TaxID=2838490 RepID=A0A9D2B3B2_9FIRM|nr:glutamate-5-semialdehyde dehydrogenase [Candidatus Blautia gallistercoris]
MSIQERIRQVKLAGPRLAILPEEVRNRALAAIAEGLQRNSDKIFQANREDMENARKAGIPVPVLNRLKFDEHKLADVTAGIRDLIGLPDPLFQVKEARELDADLVLYRETCPIGVIGVIFEARPDALVQISALCIKSGNCAVLKGGSEAMQTNKALFSIIYEKALEAGLPENCMLQLEAREEIRELLDCHDSVDLLIPRGSNAFVQYIMNNTKIPVMGHADGICHIYVDKDADLAKAVPVIVDAKTQYVSACNTVETLLVHTDVVQALMPALKEALDAKHVEIRGTAEIRQVIDCEPATEEDFSTEYLDYILSVKTVENAEEAIRHINMYGSHHTDCIITENRETAALFMQMVDSAGVYQNCSTRFADGYRYGLGAEVGISTGKIHARGPVGLEGLVSYKYKLFGKGQVVDDYASGRKQFHFKNI